MKKIFLLTLIISILICGAAMAECAWVLWEKEIEKGEVRWTILDAFPDYDQCVARQRLWLELGKKGFEDIKTRRDPLNRISDIRAIPFFIFVDYEDGLQRVFSTYCLPDTVDPRK